LRRPLFRRYEKHARQTINGDQWWLSVLIGMLALGLLLQKRGKIPEPAIVAVAAAAGIALHN